MTSDLKNRPPDWALDMARIPFDPNAERAAANATCNGPRGMSPPSDPVSRQPAAPNTSGWQHEVEIGPQRDIALIDRMCVNADQRERQQAQAPDMMTQMATACMAMMQMQSQTIAILAQQLTADDRPKAKAAGGNKP